MFQFTQTVMFTDEQASLPTSMLNAPIADVLFNIATLLEMQQGNPYRIAAYRKAARGLKRLREPAAAIISRGERLELPGLGKRLRRKITELVTTGQMAFYNDLCEELLPEDVRQLMTAPHVGPKTALRLSNHLRIHSIAELYEAAHAHKLREHHGFGSRSEQRLENGTRALLQRQQAAATPAIQAGHSNLPAA